MEPLLCIECTGSGAVIVSSTERGVEVLTCPRCGGGCIEPPRKKVRPSGTDNV